MGQIHFESRTPAGYFALARREASPAAVVVGTLRLPSKDSPKDATDATGRVPAMVIAHGSAGVDVREMAWADRLGTAAHVTGAPLLFLLGGRDDYTPAEACGGYAEWFKTAGAETTVVTYASSYHDFDAERSPRYERTLVTGCGCDMAVDLDHFAVARRGTGEDITASAGQYGRNCLSRGATIGGDAEARRRAPADVAAFLRRVLKPQTH